MRIFSIGVGASGRKFFGVESCIRWRREAILLDGGAELAVIILTDDMVSWVGLPGKPRRAAMVFHSSGCPYCVRFVPVVQSVEGFFRGRLTIYSVDVTRRSDTAVNNPNLASMFVTDGIPLVVLFADGRPVGRHAGALDAPTFRAFLESFLATNWG